MDNDNGSALIAEQLRHTLDLLRAELEKLQAEQQHGVELANHRLLHLEESSRDHESRLRSLQDGVTQFKVWSGLVSGGSSLFSLFALFRAWLGG